MLLAELTAKGTVGIENLGCKYGGGQEGAKYQRGEKYSGAGVYIVQD